MKKTILSVLTASFLCFGSCYIATAQAPVAQSDRITDGDTQEIIQADSSSSGSFETVTVDATASSDVQHSSFRRVLQAKRLRSRQWMAEL